MNLKQFWTFYPQEDNSFIGFIIHPNSRKLTKLNRVLVYGKKKQYFEGHEHFLKFLSTIFEVHTTITDDVEYAVKNGFANHKNLSPEDFNELLSSVKVFVGLGFPYEGPSPVEALESGAYFLNPVLDPPVGRSEERKSDYIRDFFNDKPTFRRLHYQVPYLSTLNTSLVINAELQV